MAKKAKKRGAVKTIVGMGAPGLPLGKGTTGKKPVKVKQIDFVPKEMPERKLDTIRLSEAGKAPKAGTDLKARPKPELVRPLPKGLHVEEPRDGTAPIEAEDQTSSEGKPKCHFQYYTLAGLVLGAIALTVYIHRNKK